MYNLTDYLSGCACQQNMGMVQPANVATLGKIPSIKRSVASYDRAIVRLQSKIGLLKKKKRKARTKVRKRLIQNRIDRLNKNLTKLRGYRAIRKGKNPTQPVATDEDLLLQEAIAPEPLINELEIDEVQEIAAFDEGMKMWQIALIGLGIAGLAYAGVKNNPFKKKPRRNRIKVGKKSNPRKRRRKTKR